MISALASMSLENLRRAGKCFCCTLLSKQGSFIRPPSWSSGFFLAISAFIHCAGRVGWVGCIFFVFSCQVQSTIMVPELWKCGTLPLSLGRLVREEEEDVCCLLHAFLSRWRGTGRLGFRLAVATRHVCQICYFFKKGGFLKGFCQQESQVFF